MTSHKDFDMEEIMEIEHAMGRNAKKPADLNAPKRGMSAYFLWAIKTRTSVVKEFPDASLGEVGKKLGAMWREVSGSDRAPFEAKAKKERESYDKKKEKYIKTAHWKRHQKNLYAWKIHETKKPYHKDTNAPKRGLSAYMLYAESVRGKIVKENPDMGSTDIMREQSVWWKALSEKDRKPFVEKAASEKAKHEKRLQRYMKTADFQTYSEGKEKYKLDMKEKRNKLMGIRKKKRARTGPKSTKAQGHKSPSKKKLKRKVKSKSRSRKRRSKTPKSSKSRSRSTKRKAKTPKGPKKKKSRSRTPSRSRSTSRSTSRSRSKSSKKSKSPKRRPGRREKRRSKSKSKKRSTGRRAMKAKKRRGAKKAKKKTAEDSDVAE